MIVIGFLTFLVFFILLVIGGINWGLIGVFQFDIIAALFGKSSKAARIIDTLIGIAGILVPVFAFIYMFFKKDKYKAITNVFHILIAKKR